MSLIVSLFRSIFEYFALWQLSLLVMWSELRCLWLQLHSLWLLLLLLFSIPELFVIGRQGGKASRIICCSCSIHHSVRSRRFALNRTLNFSRTNSSFGKFSCCCCCFSHDDGKAPASHSQCKIEKEKVARNDEMINDGLCVDGVRGGRQERISRLLAMSGGKVYLDKVPCANV